jgi:hypothetical protein
MEVKYLGLILMLTTMIAVAGVSILFLYTMKNIEMPIWTTEFARIKKVNDADYLHSNTKLVMDVLKQKN